MSISGNRKYVYITNRQNVYTSEQAKCVYQRIGKMPIAGNRTNVYTRNRQNVYTKEQAI